MVTDEMVENAAAEMARQDITFANCDRGWQKRTIRAALEAALSAQVQDVAEYERREQVCKETAMSQWERSLKRPDLTEKDRVIGAVEAYKRQAFAFTMLPAAPAKQEGGE